MPVPIRDTAAGLDLTPRVFTSTTVAASPAGSTETTVCTLTVTGDIAALAGVLLMGFVAFTIGTSGTAISAQIRRTNTLGTSVVSSGAVQGTAANLTERQVIGFDTGAAIPGQVYVLTLTVTGGAAASTVSAATLVAVVI